MIIRLLICAAAITAIHEVSAENSVLDKTLNPTMLMEKIKSIRPKANPHICEENGHTCLDCEQSRYCFKVPGGDFITNTRDCSANGETCLMSTGECTSEKNIECDHIYDIYEFVCQQLGMFPHPYDCTKFYICTTDDIASGNFIRTEKECYDATYNSRTTHCSFSRLCRPSVIGKCEEVGTVGAVRDNPNMYYTCLSTTIHGNSYVVPQLKNCPDGDRFVDGECGDPFPPTPKLDADNKCTSSGLYYDPEDCNNFIKCVVGEEPAAPEACGVEKYFDEWKQSCLDHKCSIYVDL